MLIYIVNLLCRHTIVYVGPYVISCRLFVKSDL